MTEHRKRMMAAFKSHFVPALRERGFAGSFPHFRRTLTERVDHLNVQFYSAGGSFTLNLGRTGPNGFTEGPWKDLPIDEIEVGHIFTDRRRLTPRDGPSGLRGRDFWEFGPRSYDEPKAAEPQARFDEIADDALAALVSVGEPWFARPDPPDTGAKMSQPGRQPGDPTRFSHFFSHLRLRRPRMRVGVVLGGCEAPLWRWENWQKIVPVMDELVTLLPRPVSIHSSQAHEKDMKDLPFGRMNWGAAGNRKWTGKYLDGPEPVSFGCTEFWSPSRSTWADESREPEMYARLEGDPDGEGQGFILALRRDQLRTPGLAEAADRTLDAVAAAMPGARRVINDRGWAETKILQIEIGPLDHPAAETVHEWGEKRPWSQVPSFTAR